MAIDLGQAFKLGTAGISNKPGFGSLGELVSLLIKNVYTVAGIIFFFLLIFGGVTFIVNAGKNDAEAASKSKNTITAAVLGFLIIFLSYWLIQLLEKILGIKILNPNV